MTGPSVAEVSWYLAFLAGVVSFLSPCVLPLIPGYISMVSKMSFEELTDGTSEVKIKKILLPTVLFVLGFSVVFVMLGTSASLIGSFIVHNKTLLLKIAGVIIIVFGLFVMDILKFAPFYKERRFSLPANNLGPIGIFLLGIAFGFGWMPCVGPILASILLYASTAEGASTGAALLFVYSLGLGLPFIVTGLALSRALKAFSLIKRHYTAYKFTVGGVLVALGGLMVTNYMFYLNVYGLKLFNAMGIDFWQKF